MARLISNRYFIKSNALALSLIVNTSNQLCRLTYLYRNVHHYHVTDNCK